MSEVLAHSQTHHLAPAATLVRLQGFPHGWPPDA